MRMHEQSDEQLPDLAELLQTVSENFHRRRATLNPNRTFQADLDHLLPSNHSSGFGLARETYLRQADKTTYFPRLSQAPAHSRGHSHHLLKTTGFRARLEEISEESSRVASR
jgi:hypothetical protein